MELPRYELTSRKMAGKTQLLDPIRKKWVALTPEEFVRQNLIQHLVVGCGYPQALIASEMAISVNGTTRRCDLVVHDKRGAPLVLVECKGPGVGISQSTFDQAAGYNLRLGVCYFILCSGPQLFFCKVDEANKRYVFLDSIPRYDEL